LANRILRILERTLLAGGAMDAESLCVQSGMWVWRLHVQVTVLDHGGNLVDASVLAAIAALRHFRVPQVTLDAAVETVGGGGGGEEDNGGNGRDPHPVVVHSDDREPTPLPLHHTPLSSTFALYHCNNNTTSPTTDTVSTLIDPTHREELVMDGTITFSFNRYGEMCSLDFPGGCELHPRQLKRCAELGKGRCVEMCGVLEKALEEADGKAGRDRLERLRVVREREEVVVDAVMGGGRDDGMDNRHLLPDIPRVGVPFLKQTRYDNDNNNKTKNQDNTETQNQKTATVLLQVPQDDLNAPGSQTAAIAAAEEERYRLQALDYSSLHVAAKVREDGSGSGGRVTNGGSGGRVSGVGGGRPIQGSGSLMAAMLKSATTIGGGANTEMEEGGITAGGDAKTSSTSTTAAANTSTTAVSSHRTQEAEDEFAQFAAAEKAKLGSSSQRQQQRQPLPPPTAAATGSNAPTPMEGVLDSDEEEVTTTLQGEFVVADGDNKAVSSIQTMEVDDDTSMKDDVNTNTAPTVGVSKVVAVEEEEEDVDDLAMAVVKKKKKSKKGNKKNRNKQI